jgi:hypothetical protein
MICPHCKAEYREGFTVCADCEVPLVNRPNTDEEDPYCAFWEGEDERIFAEICTVLGESAIAHRALRHDSQIFRVSSHSKMRIGVPFSQFEKAEVAVVEAFGGASETKKLLWPTEEDRPEYAALVDLQLEDKLLQERTANFDTSQQDESGEESTEDEPPESLSEAFARRLPDEPNGQMYCPLCGAEYREGFAECSDCRVGLVATRAQARSSRARLWKGHQQHALDRILAALGAEQIPTHYKDIVNAVSQVRIMGIPIGPNRSTFEYEVWVFRSDLEKAKAAIKTPDAED